MMRDIDFSDVNDHYIVTVRAYDIQPKDPQKRLRVLGGWLADEIFVDMNMYNHATRISAWLKQAQKLQHAYNIHTNHINEIVMDVWARYQYTFKTEIKPSILKWKRNIILSDLKRMGF